MKSKRLESICSSALRGLVPAGLVLAGLVLGVIALSCALPARGDEAPAPQAEQPKDKADKAPEAEAAQAAPTPEPERISGKLSKVDAEGKTITVEVAPDRGRSMRAYKHYKLVLDDKSLILVDQQP